MIILPSYLLFFFFNDTATTEIYTLSLHDALPISRVTKFALNATLVSTAAAIARVHEGAETIRSEEHTSELQSRLHLVCRLLLEKKKKKTSRRTSDSRATTPRPHDLR